MPNSFKSILLFICYALGNRIGKTEIYPGSVDGVKELATYYVY